MAVQVGTRTSYDSIVGLRLDVEDAIHMISPFDVPFMGTFGMDRGSVLGSDETTSTKVEWLEDELVPASDALNGAITTGSAFITVDNQTYFKTNDLVMIDEEYLRVSGYGTSADTLTVQRAWGGTAVNHADDATILILGTLPAEGSDPVSGINFQRVQPYNVTQIYQDEVEITRTEEKEAKYGVQSESAYQIAKRVKENAIKMERNLILGVRVDDTTNKKRSMGGLHYYITDNVDSTTTALTETLLVDQMQASFDAGGSIDLLACGGTQKRNISAFNADDIRFARDENIRGAVVDWIDSDFGRVYIVLNRWVPTRFLFGLEKQYINLTWFDRPFVEALAKTGDRQQWEYIAEMTMKVRNTSAHFKFTALQ